jgi:hypothetical protein
MADNAAVARAMMSLAEYELMIRNYRDRYLSERNQLWFGTIVRQRDLKRREARSGG